MLKNLDKFVEGHKNRINYTHNFCECQKNLQMAIQISEMENLFLMNFSFYLGRGREIRHRLLGLPARRI